MTAKQLSKLEARIATLKQAHRIVWIEGIEAEVIKGKIAGKECYFVKADSLNANGGSWYYIVRWESVEWVCSCESVQPCKHCRAVGTKVNARFAQPTEAERAEALAISQHLQAEAYAREIEAQRLADEKRTRYVAMYDPCLVA